jgi:GNAT superfamily N-acetyltransferase
MTTVLQATMPDHKDEVNNLFAEYLRWVCPRILQEYNAVFDAESILIRDMEKIKIFLPPKGILLLAFQDGAPAGCACSRAIGDHVAELKRMYVRPTFRRKGIGRLLVNRSIEKIISSGYTFYRLDSAGFMSDAHALYRSFGFKDISAYEESEIPEIYKKYWVFMELELGTK